MKRLAPLLMIFLWGIETPAQDHDRPDPKEIMDRVDRMMRGESSRGRVEMTVATKRWDRSLSLEIWSEGTEKALIRILEPKKEAGTATLKVGPDIWNYLPKIDQTIRVPSSMMMGSWMGSHFTNDDLVKESQLIQDYHIEISYDGEREGAAVYEFILTPFPEAPVVWGRVEYQVRQADLMPLWARYYDEDGQLKRTMVFSGFQRMDDRVVPTVMRLTPADNENEYTQMVYKDLEFDLEIPERTFSLQALRR